MSSRLIRVLGSRNFTSSATNWNKGTKLKPKKIKSVPRPENVIPFSSSTFANNSNSNSLFETDSYPDLTGNHPIPSIASEIPSSIQTSTSTSEEGSTTEENSKEYSSEEETIYTAEPSFSVPLVLTATFVASVFCLNAGDMARVGYSTFDELTGEYEIAPRWMRWGIATGFAAVGLGVLSYGVIVPARIVTKLTIKRPLLSRTPFPANAIITLHTPITKLPFLSPKSIPLEKIILLGPLSTKEQSYHPKDQKLPPSDGFVRRLLKPLADALIAPPSTKPKKSHWDKAKSGIPLPSHVPLLLIGDRASYTMAVRRGPTGLMHDPKGAWCCDWEGLERGLLGVK